MVMAAGNNFAFKIAIKPLQTDRVTIDSRQKIVIALSNGTIVDSGRRTV